MVHYAFGICPVALAAVLVDSCPIWLDSTLDQILGSCLGFLPAFPYAHPYPSAQPLVNGFKRFLGIGQLEVINPSTDGLVNL